MPTKQLGQVHPDWPRIEIVSSENVTAPEYSGFNVRRDKKKCLFQHLWGSRILLSLLAFGQHVSRMICYCRHVSCFISLTAKDPDDTDIIVTYPTALKKAFLLLERAAGVMSLKINEEKTKYMRTRVNKHQPKHF
jgi:hypothetical protein